MADLDLIRKIADLEHRIMQLEIQESSAHWTWLTTPLTSTSFDGDAFTTTAKTLIDLSVSFGAPAGIKAIAVRIFANDSASAATSGMYFGISPNNTAGDLAVVTRPSGVTNDYKVETGGVCPCDTNGDVYYQLVSSGASTLDAWLQIWGYYR